jgi:Ca2+/H+ antiporter, TMEM165/GDT1 family
MNSALLVTAISAGLAAAVEMVEAVTIVLAVGVTRQWRSTLFGVAAALVVLVVIVAVFGAAIVAIVPIEALRLLIGALLLIFGLQWLTKAILRAAGAKQKHDEAEIYAQQIAELRDDPQLPPDKFDGISFTVAFKGVFLEGLEVAFIVITFGLSAGALGAAAAGAAIAAIAVLIVAFFARRPLAAVPENQLKYAVGLFLVTFGTFWSGEGLGVEWPGEDLALLAIFAGYLGLSLALTWLVGGRLRSRIVAR